MTHTHIRTPTGIGWCGSRPDGPWESISLQHYQVARQQADWMGLRILPVPLCAACEQIAADQPTADWPSLGASGTRPHGRWLR